MGISRSHKSFHCVLLARNVTCVGPPVVAAAAVADLRSAYFFGSIQRVRAEHAMVED